MVRIVTNTIRSRADFLISYAKGINAGKQEASELLSSKAKMLAWAFFILLFVENDTLGFLPRQAYMIYRNVRISDLILYGSVIYSLFNVNEFEDLFRSKLLILVKFILYYFLFEFLISIINYPVNAIEYFFRLKGIWFSFLVFPFLLLFKWNGFNYLLKIMLPFTIVANILYILTATTGATFMPGTQIVKQSLPGGLEVYRVFGGTFYGEYFFLGFIFKWITDKFRLYQLPLVILFVTPHILAFGRSAWIGLSFTIIITFIWDIMRRRKFKILFRQAVIFTILGGLLIYSFIKIIPQSDYLIEALGARVSQGEEDYTHNEGTYGTRTTSTMRLFELWLNSNVVIGIGMHPMWVLAPVTVEESMYEWGFSDVRWASVLAAYGAIGFLLAIAYQIYYFFTCAKILKNNPKIDILQLFIVLMLATMFLDSTVYYSNNLISVGLLGLTTGGAISVAAVVYKYEEMKKLKSGETETGNIQ